MYELWKDHPVPSQNVKCNLEVYLGEAGMCLHPCHQALEDMGAGAYFMEDESMEWIMLLAAGILEVTWAVFMKMSEGFTRLIPGVVTAIGYIASAVFLALALRKLPLGTAYAMWTGFGILGTTIIGALIFKETISLPQAGCILMIVVGIAGLKLLA